MTFASVQFGILLVACLACYFWLPSRGRLLLMLAASYVFYAYWNPWYAILIFVSTAIDYGAGLWIAATDQQRRKRLAVWVSVVSNLALLGYFKYTNFGLHVLHQVLGPLADPFPQALDIILPVGISFYTFQSMSYTIDVYRGDIPAERSFASFALYVSFFPQLVAGPIERAADLLPQLKQYRPYDPVLFEDGVRLLLWGFTKKLVVADRLFAAAMPIMQSAVPQAAPDLLFATLGLSTMLYFDFSAYTDMARGTAALFGVRLTENFRLPMAATSIAEFWRTWHITLSSWVRDYVYIPLGGMRPRGFMHQALILLITMGLVGLWHGANWTYVVWGLQHGVMMVLYQLYFRTVRRRWRRSRWINSAWFAFLGWALTMAMHAVSMVWFFSPTPSRALECLGRFVAYDAWVPPQSSATLPGAVILAALWILHAASGSWQPLDKIARLPAPLRAACYAMLFFIIIGLGVQQANLFVYFQF
jgi:D-alanyl-lipoteichoic acid acyltransferase DltB (MBOAT superfamily)